ncbi:MAG: phosphoadenosine phosphosulfate reductase [Sedimentitalea sp.]|nr:phosphoadenosine phosphosulfate reductase [Sedimentitalea sp.]
MFHDPDRVSFLRPGLQRPEWRRRLTAPAGARIYWQQLDARHLATFTDASESLLVTFETDPEPAGALPTAAAYDLVQRRGWSHLGLIADGATWFRASAVYDFFDQMIDDGYFEEFARVLFLGAGPAGYAAAAFSVSAPGATVLALQPQATLDPDLAGWDDRFVQMRRAGFSDRFGYAPDMLDAAERAFVVYDPLERFDAMHAALFHRPNVTRLRAPGLGPDLESSLAAMGLLDPLLTLVGRGALTPPVFHRLMRARRDHPPYLRRLMVRLDAAGRPGLTERLCRNVTARMTAPKFQRRLDALTRQPADRAPDR